MGDEWDGAIRRAQTHAPFLAGLIAREPGLAALLAEGRGEEALAVATQAGAGVGDTALALRRERRALALVLAIGDLAGAFPLARVMEELSAFADRALDRAIAAAIRARVPDAQPAGFVVLALGKHGSRELNYSSDIDPILLYDPELLPRRPRDEPGEVAQRYAREIVRLLSEVTAEGYVFRVDLRLRPAAEISPPALPLEAAITHYESSALAWERAAFIRARPAAGDLAAGQAFLDHIRPFVWRRSLDFGAIDEIRRLSARIRDHHAGAQVPGAGFDLKLGRGGIREIEFYAQTHQLIHGGRDATLRQRGTRAALDALAAASVIAEADATMLGAAYDRLRSVEHRVQMIADQQSHSLGEDAALDAVARLDGLAGGAVLVGELAPLCAAVAARYDAMLGPGDVEAGEAAAEVPPAITARAARWSDGRYRALRSEAALAAFDALRPQLLATFAQASEPEVALARWETLLERMPAAINVFRLLEARPGLLSLLLDCLTLAPPLADELARRPERLGALIDRSAFDLPGSVADLAADMRTRGGGYEAALDRIRIVVGERRFALGVQLIEAAHDPLDISAGLSRLAEAAIVAAQDAASLEFAAAHGRVPDSELVVLGLGRLGGGALTHASDLDLIYIFTEGAEASDGPRPLGRTLYFNRLAQRLGAALSVPTAEGALYEVDTRLRPQGEKGPLAVSLQAFMRYQRQDAWTWEHMALTRARALTGSPEAKEAVSAAIKGVLDQPRDAETLRRDVLAMRAEMAAHKPARGPLDAKLLRGGLVDLEFLVHYLQLRHRTGLDPELIAALAQLEAAGLVPGTLGAHLRSMTRILVGARLLAPDLEVPRAAAARVLARQTGAADTAALVAALGEARHGVAEAWATVFGEPLEEVECS